MLLAERLLNYEDMVQHVPFFNEELKNNLLNTGFFEDDELFPTAFARTKELLRLTKALNLEWSRPDSPYIIGLLSEIYKLFYKRIIIIDEGENLMGSDKVINRKTKQIKIDEFYPETLELSVFKAATFGKLTEEEIFCIRFLENPHKIAICSYPNILWVFAANRKISCDFLKTQNSGVTPSNTDEYYD